VFVILKMVKPEFHLARHNKPRHVLSCLIVLKRDVYVDLICASSYCYFPTQTSDLITDDEMAAHVRVRVCGLGLLPPRLNGGPVCDESAAEGSLRANAALGKFTLSVFLLHSGPLR